MSLIRGSKAIHGKIMLKNSVDNDFPFETKISHHEIYAIFNRLIGQIFTSSLSIRRTETIFGNSLKIL